jgi:hypothetical protein
MFYNLFNGFCNAACKSIIEKISSVLKIKARRACTYEPKISKSKLGFAQRQVRSRSSVVTLKMNTH